MVNKAILVGHVGNDPEVKHLESGSTVANFSLATTETYKNKQGERVSNTEWHNIVIWRGLAEVVEKYVKKGDPLFLEGKITTRKWEDKNGNKRYTTEVVCDNMVMLKKKGSEGVNEAVDEGVKNDKPEPEDDLPF